MDRKQFINEEVEKQELISQISRVCEEFDVKRLRQIFYNVASYMEVEAERKRMLRFIDELCEEDE